MKQHVVLVYRSFALKLVAIQLPILTFIAASNHGRRVCDLLPKCDRSMSVYSQTLVILRNR